MPSAVAITTVEEPTYVAVPQDEVVVITVAPIGLPGTNGAPGAPGANGNTILSGAGAPAVGDGVNGDYWIRTSNWTIYGPKAGGAWPAAVSIVGPQGIQGIQGNPGIQGIQGVPGADGRTLLSGAGAPAGGTGANGDFYINTTSWLIYGPKAAGAWPAGVSLIGSLSPITINDQAAAYTLVLSDAGKLVRLTTAGAVNLSVPTNAAVAFPIGTRIVLAQAGAGQMTVVAVTPGTTTINSRGAVFKTAGQYAYAELFKVGTDLWTLTGDIVA